MALSMDHSMPGLSVRNLSGSRWAFVAGLAALLLSMLRRSFNQRLVGYGSLHKIVGDDGVLMISLERKPERSNYSAAALAGASVHPTIFAATDSKVHDSENMSVACVLKNLQSDQWCREQGRVGDGCVSQVEQAIADSHRRALLFAYQRDTDWTAILEDDIVPIQPATWDASFAAAWQHIPAETRMVRLHWCTFNDTEAVIQPTWIDVDERVRLVRWIGDEKGMYKSGGCTAGYIIHREFIPELLSVFPCCCAVDCCMEWGLLNKVVGPGNETRGMQIMVNIDAWGSTEYAWNFTFWHMHQHGMLAQDNRDLASTRG